MSMNRTLRSESLTADSYLPEQGFLYVIVLKIDIE